MEGFIDIIEALSEAPVDEIVQTLIERARDFTNDQLRDDIAVVAARFI
jgi:serine phosphatase RsbU (regulator of sigma subunit)